MKQPRIGMVGTFDVENFGDLLFPLIARRELEERLPGAEVVLYSYHDASAGSWPYDVRSLVHLPSDIEALDLLIVGGGHLVRFDKFVAPGYEPPSPRIHHPTGYWLAPTLLAACHGLPVAWNALSASLDTPEWARGLLRAGLESTAYVSVRDEPSLRELSQVAPAAAIELVPDTVFGVSRLLQLEPSREFVRFAESVGLDEPYVVVQPSPHLVPHARQVDEALREMRGLDYAILELPISPCLDDRVGVLDLATPTVRPHSWPAPLLLAEVVSRSEAVIARSLHLSIVALACGVPVHRHTSAPDPKYRALDGFRGVVWWEDGRDPPDFVQRGIGRRLARPEVDAQVVRLKAHWDAIAGLTEGPRLAGAQVASDLIACCTSELERLGTVHAPSDGDVDSTPAGASPEALSLDLRPPSFLPRRLRARLARRRLRTPPTPSP